VWLVDMTVYGMAWLAGAPTALVDYLLCALISLIVMKG